MSVLLGSFLLAGLVTALAAPTWRRLAIRWQVVDRPGPRKLQATAIPLLGGLAVLLGFATSLVVAREHLQGSPLTWLAIALAVVTGVLDDLHKDSFPVLMKSLALMAAAFTAATSLPEVAHGSLDHALALIWCFVVMNAFNLSDNANGLAAGLAAAPFVASTLAGAAGYGDPNDTMLACVAGACLGFLPFNYPKARLFLGDAGSFLLGTTLAISINPWRIGWLAPALLAVPLCDVAWVTIARTKLGIPPWRGDRRHLSHRLTQAGVNSAAAVAVLWGTALVVATIALLLSPRRL